MSEDPLTWHISPGGINGMTKEQGVEISSTRASSDIGTEQIKQLLNFFLLPCFQKPF